MTLGFDVGRAVAVGVALGSCVGSRVAVAVGAGVSVAVGAGVWVAVGSGVAVAVGAGVWVAVGSGVAVAVGSGVGRGVGGGVGCGVGVGVGAGVGFGVGAGVGRGVPSASEVGEPAEPAVPLGAGVIAGCEGANDGDGTIDGEGRMLADGLGVGATVEMGMLGATDPVVSDGRVDGPTGEGSGDTTAVFGVAVGPLPVSGGEGIRETPMLSATAARTRLRMPSASTSRRR